jgi:hypothetical protein
MERSMPFDAATSEAFRQFETSVLDVHHSTLPLWNRDRPTALFAALAQFDCMIALAPFIEFDLNALGQTQVTKGQEEGLSQALRWLNPGDRAIGPVSTNDPSVIEEAGRFCHFASDYVNIADMHKMFGRGLMEVQVDKDRRRVKFTSLTGARPAMALMGMAESTHRIAQMPAAKSPEKAKPLADRVHAVMKSAKFHDVDGRLVIDDVSIANVPDIAESFPLAYPVEELFLGQDADLIGFSVEHLTRYFESLRRWSFCCTYLFIVSLNNHGTQQWQCAPTQVVERKRFLDSIQQLSGLSADIVEAITLRLTYDNRTTAVDVFQQPLLCGDGTVSWSVSVVQSSRYVRNMLRLMARTKASEKHAATLIGSRERSMLNELGGLLSRQGGTAFKLMTEIGDEQKEGEVDLLAYNPKFPDEVLLVEGKAFLGVDEINEVDAATKEMQKAQAQLDDAVEIMTRIPQGERQNLFKFVNWGMVKDFYCVVVATGVEPNDKYDHTSIPGISLETIQARLRENHFESPKKFWTACKNRQWLQRLLEYREVHHPIKVGDVTYELPMLKEPADQAAERHRNRQSATMAKIVGKPKSGRASRRSKS